MKATIVFACVLATCTASIGAQDVLSQASEVTIDFRSMRLALR